VGGIILFSELGFQHICGGPQSRECRPVRRAIKRARRNNNTPATIKIIKKATEIIIITRTRIL